MYHLKCKPLYIGAAAVYPYDPLLVEDSKRTSRFKEQFSLCTVTGTGENKRILLPRRMASSLPVDKRSLGLDVKFTSMFKARNTEQERCKNEIVTLMSKRDNFIFEAPTGFGKTTVTTAAIAEIGKKTIIIVHKEDLVERWLKDMRTILGLSLGKSVGMVQGDRCDVVGKKVVIAMVQSLAKDGRYPPGIFDDFGLAIWDEVHMVGADFFSQSCYRIPARLRLGVSATPDRKDGREEVFFSHIGPVKVVTKVAATGFRVIVEKSPWQIPLRRKMDKDGEVLRDQYGEALMAPVPHDGVKNKHVTLMMSKHHERNKKFSNFTRLAYDKGRTTILLSDRVEHLEIMEGLLLGSKIPKKEIGYYIGKQSKEDLEETKKKRVVLATYQMASTGTDIPELDTLIFLSPRSDVRQIIGRIRRACEGKKEPLAYDLVDDTSAVFENFFKARLSWYKQEGAKVEFIGF